MKKKPPAFDPTLPGRRIRETREIRGWSQSEFGSLAGFSGANISHFECGRREPNLRNLRALTVALSVTTDYLLGLSDD